MSRDNHEVLFGGIPTLQKFKNATKFKILDLNPFKIDTNFAIIQENVGQWSEKDAVTFFSFNTYHFYFKLRQM